MKNSKVYQITMDERIHRELKAMAAMRGLTAGETIQGLIKFANLERYLSGDEQKTFVGHLETVFLNVGNMSSERVARHQQSSMSFNGHC